MAAVQTRRTGTGYKAAVAWGTALWIGALSGKGWGRLSGSPPVPEGMSLAWFRSQGLISLAQWYEQLNH